MLSRLRLRLGTQGSAKRCITINIRPSAGAAAAPKPGRLRCYKAANWIYLGQTTGRGRMDRENKRHGEAVKDIYVYPLVRNPQRHLCATANP